MQCQRKTTLQGLNPEEYTVLNFIHGIARGYSAGILADIDSVKAFQNTNSLAKYCSIIWNDNDSDDFVRYYINRSNWKCHSTQL